MPEVTEVIDNIQEQAMKVADEFIDLLNSRFKAYPIMTVVVALSIVMYQVVKRARKE